MVNRRLASIRRSSNPSDTPKAVVGSHALTYGRTDSRTQQLPVRYCGD